MRAILAFFLYLDEEVFNLKKRYVISLFMASLLAVPTTIYGDDLDQIRQKYESINSQKSEIQKQLESNNALVNRAMEELKSLEAEIKVSEEEFKKAELELQQVTADTIKSKEELKQAQVELAERQSLLGSRLNSIYKSSSSSYLEVILGSEDILDLFDRLNMVKNIVKYDRDVIVEVKNEKQIIETKTAELEVQKKSSEEATKSLQQKKTELANLSQSKEAIMANLQKNDSDYKSQIATLTAESDKALNEIATREQAAKAAAATQSSQIPASPVANGGSTQAQASSNSQAAPPQTDYSYSSKGEGMIMEATAYDPSPFQNGGYGGITAMGTTLRPGIIAVDPRVIPLGTKVYIEYMDGTPLGYCVAEDTGGDIKGNRIDILFMSNAEAIQFGRRNMKLYILN